MASCSQLPYEDLCLSCVILMFITLTTVLNIDNLVYCRIGTACVIDLSAYVYLFDHNALLKRRIHLCHMGSLVTGLTIWKDIHQFQIISACCSLLQVIEKRSADWWYVQIGDKEGWAPANCISDHKVSIADGHMHTVKPVYRAHPRRNYGLHSKVVS